MLLVALVFVLAQGYVFAFATLMACVCDDASWVDRIQLPDVFQCSVIVHADSLWWRKLQNDYRFLERRCTPQPPNSRM